MKLSKVLPNDIRIISLVSHLINKEVELSAAQWVKREGKGDKRKRIKTNKKHRRLHQQNCLDLNYTKPWNNVSISHSTVLLFLLHHMGLELTNFAPNITSDQGEQRGAVVGQGLSQTRVLRMLCPAYCGCLSHDSNEWPPTGLIKSSCCQIKSFTKTKFRESVYFIYSV